eukprot:GHVU01209369.1.p4 GENE.GHVU01209369.1~~GHVU01209369.1.p4  ORF type:complete len:108 (+),score=11.97 GHVU01209369.1:988-1311(+)
MMPCYQKRIRGRDNHIETKHGQHKCTGIGGEGETLLALLLRKNANEDECEKDGWMRQDGTTTIERQQTSFIPSFLLSFLAHFFSMSLFLSFMISFFVFSFTYPLFLS